MLTTLIPMSVFAAETNEVVEIPDEEFIEEAAEAPDESSYDDFDETPGKYNNFKSIKVTKKPSKKGLKLKKTFKIKATATKKGKKAKAHRKLAYESDNEKVVTVSKSGKIKAVGKGTANIYIYAADGTFKKIKVKVK